MRVSELERERENGERSFGTSDQIKWLGELPKNGNTRSWQRSAADGEGVGGTKPGRLVKELMVLGCVTDMG